MAKMVFENNAWHLISTWDISDVQTVIEDDEREAVRNFTEEDCVRVLETVVEFFDANFGVNWDGIRDAVDIVADDK